MRLKNEVHNKNQLVTQNLYISVTICHSIDKINTVSLKLLQPHAQK